MSTHRFLSVTFNIEALWLIIKLMAWRGFKYQVGAIYKLAVKVLASYAASLFVIY